MKLTIINGSFGNYKQTWNELTTLKGSFVKGKADEA